MPRTKKLHHTKTEETSAQRKAVNTKVRETRKVKSCDSDIKVAVTTDECQKQTQKYASGGEHVAPNSEKERSGRCRLKRKMTEQQTVESDTSQSKKKQRSTTVSACNENGSEEPLETGKRGHCYATRNKVTRPVKKQNKSDDSAVSLTVKPEPEKPTDKKRLSKKTSGDIQSEHAVSADDVKVKKEREADVGKSSDSRRSGKLVGAHCSIAGGLHNAVEEAVTMGGRAFGLFLRSQRSWNSKPLDPEAAEKFKTTCKEHGFSPNSILPHGSYLMNCGSPNDETFKKSREALLEEICRCEALGLTLYNFHPGSTCGEISVEECLDKIADTINWVHQQTKYAITVVENMSCQGNTVGGRFEELKGIIDRVKDKSRIGVCLDTCHAFAAGFDLSSKQGFEKFVSDFDSIVGFKYLKAMHLNDSKGDVGCHLDRHENIGKGKIGIDGFRRVMAEPRFDGIPMILETPLGDYSAEIKILNNLT